LSYPHNCETPEKVALISTKITKSAWQLSIPTSWIKTNIKCNLRGKEESNSVDEFRIAKKVANYPLNHLIVPTIWFWISDQIYTESFMNVNISEEMIMKIWFWRAMEKMASRHPGQATVRTRNQTVSQRLECAPQRLPLRSHHQPNAKTHDFWGKTIVTSHQRVDLFVNDTTERLNPDLSSSGFVAVL
jgi:hypothetical protein